MDEILSVGYEGVTVESFLSRLGLRGVELVIDVRLTPISRKKGFSKNILAANLAEVGIAYLHLPALGNPRDNRDGFSSTGTLAGDAARGRYIDLIESDLARASIDQILEASATKKAAILCFEADESLCHRRQVLDAIALRETQLVGTDS